MLLFIVDVVAVVFVDADDGCRVDVDDTVEFRAGEPAYFLAATAPDFFLKRLRVLIFSQAAPAPGIFFSICSAKKTGFGC